MPLREALFSLQRKRRGGRHPIGRYVDAFADSRFVVLALVAIGGDSIVFKTDNESILHITNKILTPELGNRFFDLLMLERGMIESPGGVHIGYFLQPEARTPVSERAMRDFERSIETRGWLLVDRNQHQLGIFEGATRLLDPFAVERIPFWRG
jgi:hypothetical protein